MSQALHALPSPANNRAAAMNRARRIVAEIGKLDFQGNTLPHSWFQCDLLRNPRTYKVNLLAVVILGDIVFWYRPKDIIDEATNQRIGIDKKFNEDKLQMSYEAWADKFGVSKRQIRDAVAFLEGQGLVTREFRNVRLKSGMVISNVLFVEPIVQAITEITFKLYLGPND
jgi:hypothetical protein